MSSLFKKCRAVSEIVNGDRKRLGSHIFQIVRMKHGKGAAYIERFRNSPAAPVSSKSASYVRHNKQRQRVTLQNNQPRDTKDLEANHEGTDEKSARHRSSIFTLDLVHKGNYMYNRCGKFTCGFTFLLIKPHRTGILETNLLTFLLHLHQR
jgi:hypothetical protein